jgi:hypothetical protein
MSRSTYNNIAYRQPVEPVVVHCAAHAPAVSSDPFPYQPICLQIVALPAGYTTSETVTELLSSIMSIGEPRDIRIIEKKNYNQKLKSTIVTRTALVEFKVWHNTPVAHSLYYALLRIGDNDDEQLRGQSVRLHVENTNFQWDNGDPMTHLSVREATMPKPSIAVAAGGEAKDTAPRHLPAGGEAKDTAPRQLPLTESDWNSLYIPLIPNSMSLLHPDGTIRTFQPKHLQSFIENDLQLGKVSRIDFIDRKIDNVGTVKAVFIHFEHWNDNAAVTNLRNTLNAQDHSRQHGYYDGKHFHKFIVRNENGDRVPGYFAFKINHKPIPEVAPTELNMAQLVAANKVLTEKIAERDAEILRLTEALALLQPKTDAAEAVTASA